TSGVVATPRATYRSRACRISSDRAAVATDASDDICSAPFDDPVIPACGAHPVEERRRVERLGAADARAFPGAVSEQLERQHRIDRRLPDDGLCSVLAHRLLVVGHV